jgi:hypothetical protein
VFDTVCAAIQDRAVVEFRYDGGTRIVEPHCHGRNRNGTELSRAYQIGGYSRSGKPIGWRLYNVARIVGLRRTGDSFAYARPGYTPPRLGYDLRPLPRLGAPRVSSAGSCRVRRGG